MVLILSFARWSWTLARLSHWWTIFFWNGSTKLWQCCQKENLRLRIRPWSASELVIPFKCEHCFKSWSIYLYIARDTGILPEIPVFYLNRYDKCKILPDIVLEWYGPIYLHVADIIGRYPRWIYLIYHHVTYLRSFYKHIWGGSTKIKYLLWVYDPKLVLSSFIWYM